jgi:hypothetical protein
MTRSPLARTALIPVVVLAAAGCGSPSTPPTPSPSALTSAPVASSVAAAPSTSASSPAGSTAAAASVSSQAAVAPENNPPGDIPDNLAFVPYRSAPGRYAFTHPEGWLQKTQGASVTFTDKLNGVQISPGTGHAAATAATARSQDVPLLQRTQTAFELRGISAVTEPAGTGVRIVYRRNSAPDPVTGRQYRDEVERYQLTAHGRQIVMELFGPVGADNVDAYRTMVRSLRLS